tara:strand:+ start:136 stop:423 length:288 start_codon:yes stop_codon:yes gene_type:complete
MISGFKKFVGLCIIFPMFASATTYADCSKMHTAVFEIKEDLNRNDADYFTKKISQVNGVHQIKIDANKAKVTFDHHKVDSNEIIDIIYEIGFSRI